MSDLSAGKYYGPISNFDVETTKNPLKGKQKASDALNTAKANSGSELTVIDASGAATVHALTPEKGFINKPKPTASGLMVLDNMVSPGAKPDKTKPLAIDPSIASKLGGQVALFVDEKNQTKVVNGDKNTVAAQYVDEPTAGKVDAAYTIAGDDNFVNKKMAGNVINDLNANYRNTGKASQEISLMKEGQVKTGMNAMIGELKNLSANTSGLETQSSQRTQKFNADVAKPQERLNKANSNWDTTNKAENQKINVASENLREAKFPGVHDTEKGIESAQQMVSDGKGYLQNATKKVSDAGNEVSRLESLKTKTNVIVGQNQSLESSNKKIVYDMANYLVNRKDQLVNLKASLNDKAMYYETMAEAESRKPAAPTGTSVGMTRAEADKIAQKISGGDGWVSKEDLVSNGLASLAENGAAREKVAGSDNKISTQEFSDAILLGKVNLGSPANNTGNSTGSDPFAGKPNSSGSSTGSDPFASGGNKPTGSTGNSTSNDPFAGKPNSGGSSTGSDPFAGGNKPAGSSNSTSADPFSNSNGQFKNNNAVQDFKSRAAEIRSDARNIDSRVGSINRVINEARVGGPESNSFRNAVNSLSDGYNYNGYSYVFDEKDDGYNYFNNEKSDRAVINNNFIKPYDANTSSMRENNRQIEKNVSEYKNNINGANQKLQDAKVGESQASGNLQGAQSRLTQLNAELNQINSRPALPDTTSSVKSAKTSLDNAVKNKDSVVGPMAPLTKEKNSAQGVVDSLTESHSSDIKSLNSKIAVNAAQAQQKINETKKNLGL